MLKVGITGGIGSGKTIVCQVFETLGIPVFYADEAARYIMEHDYQLIKNITQLFGDGIYDGSTLNRKKLSAVVFEQPEKLKQLNALVHPATIAYAQQWMDAKTAPYTIKEAAIFFESGSDKEMDVMVGVSAPPELRIKRAMARNQSTRAEIEKRIAQQMDNDEKMKLCDYIILNDDQTPLLPRILQIHNYLLRNIN